MDDPDDPRREAVLADIRAASLRARLALAELDALGITLKGGLVTVNYAREKMRQWGWTCLMDEEQM